MNIRWKKAVAYLLLGTLLVGLFPGTGALADTGDTAAKDNTEKVTPSGISKGELESKVDTYLKKYINDQVPGAAVTIVKDGNVVLSKGYGYNNVESKSQIDPEKTIFHFGNLSQIYTWTAVLQLAEQGKLDIEEDICSYLPEDFVKELKDHLVGSNPITLTNLMNHTAGFEERGYDTSYSDSSKLEENLKEALLTTMPNQVCPPGQVVTGDSYSVSLAAYIVEQVSGVSYPEYIKTNILDKIGASDTFYMRNEKNLNDLGDAKPLVYRKNAEENFEEEDEVYSNLYPTNAMCGTADDLTKLMKNLMQGLENGSLLSKESLELMYSKSYAINDLAKATLHGLYEYPADVAAYYIDGGMASTSMMVMMPEDGFGLVITTNSKNSLELLYGLSYYLLVEDKKDIVTAGTNLSLVTNVTDREYVGARRAFGGIMEFVGYVGNCSVFNREDKDTISLGGNKYVHVADNVYKYAGDSDNPLFKTISSTIYFATDSTDMGYKWSYSASGVAEYVCSTNNKSQVYISITIFLLVVAIVFTAGAALVSIVGLIKDAVKHRFDWKGVRLAYGILTILLMLTVLNNKALFSDIGNIENAMSSSINLHIVFNIILSALQLLSVGYLVSRLRKERQTKMRNIVILLTFVIFAGSVYFLQTWNFYSIIG